MKRIKSICPVIAFVLGLGAAYCFDSSSNGSYRTVYVSPFISGGPTGCSARIMHIDNDICKVDMYGIPCQTFESEYIFDQSDCQWLLVHY